MSGNHQQPLWTWSATAIVDAVREGTISCTDAVTASLTRISEINPLVNAVIEVDERGALATAAAIDQRRRRGESLGTLAGVPVLTKVSVDQRGSATTNGVKEFATRIADRDNPVIANLRAADAVVIGRTSVPAFSWRWFTDSDLYGQTIHPTHPELTVGGSSGGAAAAVATGMAPIAHGSDLAGSIRYPALACGVLGLRTGQGLVPSFDTSAPADRPPFAQILGTQGPLARSAGDLRLAVRAMAKASALDPWSTPVAAPAPDDGPCTVAVVRGAPWADVDPIVAHQVDLAAERLEEHGYRIVEAAPSFESTLDIYGAVLWEAGHGLLRQIEQYGDTAVRNVASVLHEISAGITPSDYFRLFGERTTMARAWSTFLEDHPIVLMPVSWQRPFPVDYDQRGADAYRRVVAALEPSIVVNLCGLPAVAVPTSSDSDSPLGVQLVGARFQEERLLAAAELLGESPVVGPAPRNPS